MSRGLFRKYTVTRTDGEAIPEGATFFVLRIDRPKDQSARLALYVYANSIKQAQPELSQNLLTLLADVEKEHA